MGMVDGVYESVLLRWDEYTFAGNMHGYCKAHINRVNAGCFIMELQADGVLHEDAERNTPFAMFVGAFEQNHWCEWFHRILQGC